MHVSFLLHVFESTLEFFFPTERSPSGGLVKIVSFVNEFVTLEERSLHTGEVEGSIPSAPTKKPLKIKHF